MKEIFKTFKPWLNTTVPFRRALKLILLSLLPFTILPVGFYLIFANKEPASQTQNHVRFIIQTGPQKCALKNNYLCQLLELSTDQPIDCSQFQCKKGREKLLTSPLIKDVDVKIRSPGVVFIDYVVRQPIATIIDGFNIAVDREGHLFPYAPFYTPRHLPEFYFGLIDQEPTCALSWQRPLDSGNFTLALKLLDLIETYDPELMVKRIDLSHINAKSYGKREIVIFFEDRRTESHYSIERLLKLPCVLRLPVKNSLKQLSNFFTLLPHLWEHQHENIAKYLDGDHEQVHLPEQRVDLRIPELAYFSSKEDNPILSNDEEY